MGQSAKWWTCNSCGYVNPQPKGRGAGKKKPKCFHCQVERGAPVKNVSYIPEPETNREPSSYGGLW